MANKTFYDKGKKVADYNIRWETIYADIDFDKERLEEIKKELVNDGYRVVHIITGTPKESKEVVKEEKPKKKRGRKKKEEK